MSKKLSVAIVGLSMGSFHLKAAIQYGANIAAICDTNPELLKKLGDECNIPKERRFLDYKEFVNNPSIDAVVLATPDQLHLPMTEAFMAAGKHVMCEKPLALTRDELEKIVAVTRKYDKKFMIGQICRFTPAFMKAKEIIDAGTIGEVYFVESEYAHDYAKILNGWRADPNRHGVVGGGCHAVDLLRWFVGDPVEVFAYGSHKLLPTVTYDDATISVLKFPNGIIGKIFVSTGCKRPYTMRTLIYGTKGTVICDNTSPSMELYTLKENDTSVNKTPTIIPLEVNNHNAFGEFTVFAEAIEKDIPLVMDAVQGAKTIAACLAIVESAKTGKPVAPDYSF